MRGSIGKVRERCSPAAGEVAYDHGKPATAGGKADRPHTPTTALGVPGVRPVSAEKRFQILKLKFTAYPLR